VITGFQAVVVEHHFHHWGEDILIGEGALQRAVKKCDYINLNGYPCGTITYAESAHYITEGRHMMSRESIDKFLRRGDEQADVRTGTPGVPDADSNGAGVPERGV